MECVHCGEPLPFLKKFGDSRFCSSDHERAWRSSVQEAMLERLRVSAEQFRRAVQKARVVAAPVPEPEPVADVAAEPPPMASFILSRPDPVDSSLTPLIRQVVAPADLGIVVPPVPSPVVSVSSPLSTDAPLVVPVDSALVVAAQSS